MKWTKAHGKITKESKEVFIEKEDGEWIFLGVKKPGKVLKVSIDWEDFGIRRLEWKMILLDSPLRAKQ